MPSALKSPTNGRDLAALGSGALILVAVGTLGYFREQRTMPQPEDDIVAVRIASLYRYNEERIWAQRNSILDNVEQEVFQEFSLGEMFSSDLSRS